jgi:two-component system, OmpR family, sensor histidine kinase CiaH
VIVARTRRRLTVINVAVLMTLVLLFGAGIVISMNSFLLAQETSNLNAEARQGAVDFEELSADEFQARHPNFATGTFYVVWNLAGIPVFNPTNIDTRPLTDAALAALNRHSGTRTVKVPNADDVLVASQLLVEDNHPIGALQVGHSLAPLYTVQNEAMVIVVLACTAMLVVSVLAGWFLAGRALVPIHEALDRQRTFTADASHELRTPLTVIDTGIQVLRRHPEHQISEYSDFLTSMQKESRRMGRLVSSLLALARADSGETELQVAEVDVAELVRAAVKDVEPLASAKDSVVETPRVDPGQALVDADRFKQLIVILVDNAVTHGPRGSTVKVSCIRHDRTIALEVSDHGPGIPADQQDKVFERFHRLSSGGNGAGAGAGLGLSIAKWIVTAHGGTITLYDNHPGLRLVVTLPLIHAAHPVT